MMLLAVAGGIGATASIIVHAVHVASVRRRTRAWVDEIRRALTDEALSGDLERAKG